MVYQRRCQVLFIRYAVVYLRIIVNPYHSLIFAISFQRKGKSERLPDKKTSGRVRINLISGEEGI